MKKNEYKCVKVIAITYLIGLVTILIMGWSSIDSPNPINNILNAIISVPFCGLFWPLLVGVNVYENIWPTSILLVFVPSIIWWIKDIIRNRLFKAIK